MARTVEIRAVLAAIVAAVFVVACATTAWAQAYLPAKGEGVVGIVYQPTVVKDHYFGTAPMDAGKITSRTLLMDVTYGVTDKLAVTVGIPFVKSKYVGFKPHPLVDSSGEKVTYSGVSPADDGEYHGAFQDFRFDVRYNLVAKSGMALTPFVGTSMPSHSYTVFAHTAPGVRLKQLQVGLSGAKLLDGVLPGLFVQGRYAFAFVEKAPVPLNHFEGQRVVRPADLSHNRSNADVEVGYFVTPRLRLIFLGIGQFTHGGIDLMQNAPVVMGPMFQYHDQITQNHFLDLGGGASFTLSDQIGLYGAMVRTVSARNGHAIDHGLSLGLSWSFSTSRAGGRMIASAGRSLAKCLCEKSGL